MIKNLNEKLNKICGLPKPKRDVVSKILKECYEDGVKDTIEKWRNDIRKTIVNQKK